jgi:trk system potassium uptake protein TrkH
VSVDDARIRQIGVFAFLYMLALALGTLVLCANGYALRESLFEFASALGTVGLSVGVTAPDAPNTVLWAETAGMFLGRLEFLVVIAAVGKVIRDFPRVVRARE